MSAAKPSGTVTFLFTDIEGSTRLWATEPDGMRVGLARHDAILRSAVEAHGGYVFSTGGDGLAAAFPRAGEAVIAALEAQTRLVAETWPRGSGDPGRAMGIHPGEAEERDGDYFGTPVNQAARLMAIGHRGAGALVSGYPRARGFRRLRGPGRASPARICSAAQRVFQLGEGRFPPLRSVDTVPGNLPTMLTELVGRAEDVADLVARWLSVSAWSP